jgi:hypothetical protein
MLIIQNVVSRNSGVEFLQLQWDADRSSGAGRDATKEESFFDGAEMTEKTACYTRKGAEGAAKQSGQRHLWLPGF